jgi:hypothetical protein
MTIGKKSWLLLLEQAIDLGGLRPGIRDRGRFGHGVQMML